MASAKKPSIYDDRSGIGSSSELDEYGVWVKTEPQDISPPGALADDFDSGLPEFEGETGGDLPELPDLDDFPGEDLAAALPEEDLKLEDFDEAALDFALPSEEGPAEEALPGEDGGEEAFSEVSLDDFLGNPDADAVIPEEEDAGAASGGDTDLLDVFPENSAALETGDFDTPEIPAEEAAPEPAAGRGGAESSPPDAPPADFSTPVLMKIAAELSSIKEELSTLKKEFSSIRDGTAPAAAETPRGFFDEEDDEKIALTGDELNNIINTAEFIEEAGTDVSAAEEEIGGGEDALPFPGEEPLPEELPGEGADLSLILDGDALDEPALADLNAEDFSLPAELDPPPDDNDELAELRETGVKPMTHAPENTAYLDESPLADPLEEGGLELPPDIEEGPLEEPSLEDLSIDLDLEEEGGDAGSLAAEDELLIEEGEGKKEDSPDPAASAETGEELIPEGFVVEGDDPPFPPEEAAPGEAEPGLPGPGGLSPSMAGDLRQVLAYMDHLLESLPEDKIEEFANSEYFDTYKKLFKELGIG